MKFYNVSLYNKALSQSEILQNYYQGPIVTNGLVFAVDAGNIVSYESGSTTTYSLTGSNSGSFTNGTSYSSNNGGTFKFDGTDDYITVNNPQSLNPGTGSFTIEAWIFPPLAASQSPNFYHSIFANSDNSTGLYFSDNGDNYELFFANNSTGYARATPGTGPIKHSQWNHVFFQRTNKLCWTIIRDPFERLVSGLSYDLNINLFDINKINLDDLLLGKINEQSRKDFGFS
jgi:hypothetical protein